MKKITNPSNLKQAKTQVSEMDLKGDMFQNGGTIVVNKGGDTLLLYYRQDNPADHVENSAILQSLGIPDDELKLE